MYKRYGCILSFSGSIDSEPLRKQLCMFLKPSSAIRFLLSPPLGGSGTACTAEVVDIGHDHLTEL